jgi:methylmalonyl-CoA mutase cobalamin-binding subunit
MSTRKELDLALEKLKAEGHEIGEKGTAAVTSTGGILILIDGVLRSQNEVMAMAGWPELP